jgi:putative effector of murein hydrolase
MVCAAITRRGFMQSLLQKSVTFATALAVSQAKALRNVLF